MIPAPIDLPAYFALHDHGFVGLIDIMGSDEAVEQAARVSYGAGTRKTSETERLIRYLYRHKHFSPFEMVETKWHIACPIFVARQWVRHRTASLNEYSGRYSVMPTTFYLPQEITKQSTTNKQGRTAEAIDGAKTAIRVECEESFHTYEDLITQGASREQARMVLPLNSYTQMYWKIDLRNLFHFFSLRIDEHAQTEIREYATLMCQMAHSFFPLCFQAWYEYEYCARPANERLDYMIANRHGVCVDQNEKTVSMSLDTYQKLFLRRNAPELLGNPQAIRISPQQAHDRFYGSA